jgi:glycine/D-amino acid oxidase-like deaminating enzyme
VAGLATALATSRAGHDVVLVERDPESPVGDAAQVFESWQRTGVARHDLATRFDGAVGEDLRDRYRAVAAEDRDWARRWHGEPIDVTQQQLAQVPPRGERDDQG